MGNNSIVSLVNYSEKSVALLMEKDGAITEELEMIGGKYNFRLSCGPGWIFSRKKSFADLLLLLDDYEIIYRIQDLDKMPEPAKGDAKGGRRRPERKEDNKSFPEWILTDEERRKWLAGVHPGSDSKYLEYLYRTYPVVVRLADGECHAIKSEALKTEFWFGESDFQGPTYEEASEAAHEARTKEDYFLDQNLNKFRDYIKCLTDPEKYRKENSSYNQLWLANWTEEKNLNRWELHWSNISPDSCNAREAIGWHDSRLPAMYDAGRYKGLSEESRARLTYAYKLALDKREKRCRAYLKRYGLSKISARTYWMDR